MLLLKPIKLPQFRVRSKSWKTEITQWLCILWKMWVGNHAFDYKRWNVNCIQSGAAWLIYIASHPGMLLMKWQHMELSADRDDKLHFQKQHRLLLWALINKLKGLKWRRNKLEKTTKRTWEIKSKEAPLDVAQSLKKGRPTPLHGIRRKSVCCRHLVLVCSCVLQASEVLS